MKGTIDITPEDFAALKGTGEGWKTLALPLLIRRLIAAVLTGDRQ